MAALKSKRTCGPVGLEAEVKDAFKPKKKS